MMNNTYLIDGDTATIFVNYKEEILKVLIDTDDLAIVKGYGTWYGNLINNHIYIKSKYRNPKFKGKDKRSSRKFMNKINKRNYVDITVSLHRILLGASSRWVIVDHRNGDTLDNRKNNLKLTTHAENLQGYNNLSSRNTSGYRGIYSIPWSNKWLAKFSMNHKVYEVGYFEDKAEAVLELVSAKNNVRGWDGTRNSIQTH